MSEFTSSYDFFYFVTPITGAVIIACVVFIYCSRYRRYQRQRNQCVFRRVCSRINGLRRRDSVHQFSLHRSAQRETAEGSDEVRLNVVQYQQYPPSSTLLHTQVSYTTIYIVHTLCELYTGFTIIIMTLELT